MADWTTLIDAGHKFENAGADTTDSKGTTVTAHANAHTKGSWSQLIASTGFDAIGFWVFVVDVSSASAEFLLDIGIGASSAEKVIVPDLYVWNISSRSQCAVGQFIPLTIPVGARLSARVQSTNAGGVTCDVITILVSQSQVSVPLGSIMTAYGVVTASTAMTTVQAHASSANTKGSWVELTSSTTAPIHSVIVGLRSEGSSQAGPRLDNLYDIGVGSAGNEKVVLSNIWEHIEDVNAARLALMGPMPCHIPVGTRVAARLQASDTVDIVSDVALWGIS